MTDVRLEVCADAEEAAHRGAAALAAAARDAVAARGTAAIALSAGRTPWRMIELLGDEEVPWAELGFWQVDERVAPRDHDDRGLKHLLAALPHPVHVAEMPVDGDEGVLEAHAAAYAAGLPARFDLVHLGLGVDGHTASLVPGDPVLDVHDHDVAISGPYQGRLRMTLTFPVLDAARAAMFLATGEEKSEAVRELLARDTSIPAARVRTPEQLVIVDRAAAGAVS
jgi:6-phosphogluconolactonase